MQDAKKFVDMKQTSVSNEEKRDSQSTVKEIKSYLNLKLIRFKNIDARHIDFSKTNANVDVRETYGMDVSHSTLGTHNVSEFTNYDGVKMVGTKHETDSNAMINYKKAITEEGTGKKL